jgi:hypothetical protein
MTTNEKLLREKAYQTLAECIRSDQLSARQVQAELEADPEFKEWYFNKYLK